MPVKNRQTKKRRAKLPAQRTYNDLRALPRDHYQLQIYCSDENAIGIYANGLSLADTGRPVKVTKRERQKLWQRMRTGLSSIHALQKKWVRDFTLQPKRQDWRLLA